MAKSAPSFHVHHAGRFLPEELLKECSWSPVVAIGNAAVDIATFVYLPRFDADFTFESRKIYTILFISATQIDVHYGTASTAYGHRV
jgi:hypothetical protein